MKLINFLALSDEEWNQIQRRAFKSCGLPSLTLADLVEHAERYGTEEVFETGLLYLTDNDLALLDSELSRIDPKRKRVGAKATEDDVRSLREQGLTISDIISATGKSERQIRLALAA